MHKVDVKKLKTTQKTRSRNRNCAAVSYCQFVVCAFCNSVQFEKGRRKRVDGCRCYACTNFKRRNFTSSGSDCCSRNHADGHHQKDVEIKCFRRWQLVISDDGAWAWNDNKNSRFRANDSVSNRVRNVYRCVII